MMKHLVRSLATAFASLVGCAQAPAEAEQGAIAPLLYAVRDQDSTMYLYGTVHVAKLTEAGVGGLLEPIARDPS